MSKRVKSVIWIFVIIAVWELSSRLGLVNAYLLPPFSTVCLTLFNELTEGMLTVQMAGSLWVIFQGYIFSIIIAMVVTAICAYSSWAESLFKMLTTIFNPLPAVAIMPLIIMWFGIDTTAMLIIVVHGVLWALVTHLLDGIKSIAQVQIEYGRNIALSPSKMFANVIFFALMPDFLSGLRIGWGRAWRALIGAEMVFGMIGAFGGLGYYIYLGRAYARINNVFAGIIIIAAIGILVETVVFGLLERYTTRKWGMVNG